MKDIGKRDGPSDMTIQEGWVDADQDGEEEQEETCREECGGGDRGEGWNI